MFLVLIFVIIIQGNRTYALNKYQDTQTDFHNQSAQQRSTFGQCCACDEAKYELVFEGLWSKYTHPDEYPDANSMASFGDIIGASHSNDFRMWDQGSLATEGVKELAEIGSTKKLESELKYVSSKTRTIIKARELKYSTLNSRTSAVFRTDRQHHLVSILSKLGPSPDWMVGVSGLDLCQSDCTWTNQKTINLYPWDAGTDSGTDFSSPDLPTIPQDPIRRINLSKVAPKNTQQQQQNREDFNSKSNSSWFTNSNYNYQTDSQMNAFGSNYQNEAANGSPSQDINQLSPQRILTEQSKPFARLTITRQRIYEKSCSSSDSFSNNMHKTNSPSLPYDQPSGDSLWPNEASNQNNRQPDYSDCRVTEWSDWSSCSSLCGKGMRTRTRSFKIERARYGCSQTELMENEVCLAECIGNTTCYTRDWSDWSKCSVDCGQGRRKRVRSIIGPRTSACRSIDLVEEELCTGHLGSDCSSSDEKTDCEVTEWSSWSECSSPCGGSRIRTREYMNQASIAKCKPVQLVQKRNCSKINELCRQSTRGHTNSAHKDVIDCKFSKWSSWSNCSATCGSGFKVRSRYVIQEAKNGGKVCNGKETKTMRCRNLPQCPNNISL